MQAGSPYFAPRAFWCIDATLRAAGFADRPYHVDVPSFGDWGFVLAAAGSRPPVLDLPADAPRLRFLDPGVLRAAAAFPADRGRLNVPPAPSSNRGSSTTPARSGAATDPTIWRLNTVAVSGESPLMAQTS